MCSLVPDYDFNLFQMQPRVVIEDLKHEIKGSAVSGLGFSYDEADPFLDAFFEQTIFKFNNEDSFEVIQLLNKIYRKVTSFREFYYSVKKVVEIKNKDFLDTEYNTAFLIGQSASKYNRLIKQVDIFPYWKYNCSYCNSLDKRHELLDGLILPVNHPTWSRLFPVKDWNCCCYVSPLISQEIDKIKVDKNNKRIAELYNKHC